jgi:hypothetical protein
VSRCSLLVSGAPRHVCAIRSRSPRRRSASDRTAARSRHGSDGSGPYAAAQTIAAPFTTILSWPYTGVQWKGALLPKTPGPCALFPGGRSTGVDAVVWGGVTLRRGPSHVMRFWRRGVPLVSQPVHPWDVVARWGWAKGAHGCNPLVCGRAYFQRAVAQANRRLARNVDGGDGCLRLSERDDRDSCKQRTEWPGGSTKTCGD